MAEKIKPCPFCGEEPSVIICTGYLPYVVCHNDKCRIANIGFTGPQWNSRPIEDRLFHSISCGMTPEGQSILRERLRYLRDMEDEVLRLGPENARLRASRKRWAKALVGLAEKATDDDICLGDRCGETCGNDGLNAAKCVSCIVLCALRPEATHAE